MARQQPEHKRTWINVVRIWIWTPALHGCLHLPRYPCPNRDSYGLRLPAAFYRDHPQFAGAAGQAEVLDDHTLLLRLEPEEQQKIDAEQDNLLLGLFLDFLSRQALKAYQGPVLYSEAMAAEDDDLLAGVTAAAADGTSGA